MIRELICLALLVTAVGTVAGSTSFAYTMTGDAVTTELEVATETVMYQQEIMSDVGGSLQQNGSFSAQTVDVATLARFEKPTLRIISSYGYRENTAAVVQDNGTCAFGSAGFAAYGRTGRLNTETRTGSGSVIHAVDAAGKGVARVGMLTSDGALRYSVKGFRVKGISSWEYVPPAPAYHVAPENNNSGLAPLCVWPVEERYPVFS